MQQDQEGPSRLAIWDSKRADGWRAGKRKRSPSPPPLAKHKTPQEILAYKPEQTENDARVPHLTDQSSTSTPTDMTAATTNEPSNVTYQQTRTSEPGLSQNVGPVERPLPQVTMMGSPPNRNPEGTAATEIAPTESVHQYSQAALDNPTGRQPTTSDHGTYPMQGQHLVGPATVRARNPSYHLARRGRRMAWDDARSAKRDRDGFSDNPGADFEVRRGKDRENHQLSGTRRAYEPGSRGL